jgi:hypothetical protein
MTLRIIKYFWVSLIILLIIFAGALFYVLSVTSKYDCGGWGCGLFAAFILIPMYFLIHLALFIVCAIALRKDLKDFNVSDRAKQYLRTAIRLFWILFVCTVILMTLFVGSRTSGMIQLIIKCLPLASFLVPILYIQSMLKLDKGSETKPLI